MRVDAVTLDQISKLVAEMYTRSTRTELETVTVLPCGIWMLKGFNRATVTARTKAAANKEAKIPSSQVNIDSAPTGKNWKRGTGMKKDEPKKEESNQKRPTGASQTTANAAPLKEVVATRPGTSESPTQAAGPDMAGTDEGRGAMGRAGGGRAEVGKSEVRDIRQAGQGDCPLHAAVHQVGRGGLGRDGGSDQETYRRKTLARDDPGGSGERQVYVERVYRPRLGREGQVGCGFEPSVRSLRRYDHEVGRVRAILFIPHYRNGHSPADSQGIGHIYFKLSYMRGAEFVIICVRRPS
jgi:hypothetical protein